MKKILILLILPFLLLTVSAFALAQDRQLEIAYPEFFGVVPPGTVKTDVAQYFRYIYYTILTISGLVALGALFYGGFRYLTSVGSPVALQDARDQIFAALLGMLILFASWVILYTVNPQLVTLQTPLLRPAPTTLAAGIWLCKEDKNSEFQTTWQRMEEFRVEDERLKGAATEKEKEDITNRLRALAEIIKEQVAKINEKCYLVAGSGGIRGDFARSGNYVTHVYSVPKIDIDPQTGNRTFTTYAGFLFEKQNFEGSVRPNLKGANALFDLAPRAPIQDSVNNNPQSVLTVAINQNWQPNWEVRTYQEVEFNREVPLCSKGGQVFRPNYVFADENFSSSPKSLCFSHSPSYIAILSKSSDYSNPKIVTANESNLLSYEQILDRPWRNCVPGSRESFWRCGAEAAAKHIFLISGRVY